MADNIPTKKIITKRTLETIETVEVVEDPAYRKTSPPPQDPDVESPLTGRSVFGEVTFIILI